NEGVSSMWIVGFVKGVRQASGTDSRVGRCGLRATLRHHNPFDKLTITCRADIALRTRLQHYSRGAQVTFVGRRLSLMNSSRALSMSSRGTSAFGGKPPGWAPPSW